MQFRRTLLLGILAALFLLAAVLLGVLLWLHPEMLSVRLGSESHTDLLLALGVFTALTVLVGGG